MANLSRLLVAGSVWPSQTFRTVPYQPPNLHITKDGTTAPGLLFFDQSWQGAIDFAPLIMTDENQLVWQGPPGVVSSFRPQSLDGEPVLTYWNGTAGYKDP